MGMSNYLPSSRVLTPGVCTSTTRPASPYEGQAIYETDTDKTLIWNGSTWMYPEPTGSSSGLVQATTNNLSTSIGGTTWVSIQSQSITPTATTDKVLVIADFTAEFSGTLDSSAYVEFELRRGTSTAICKKYMTAALYEPVNFASVEVSPFDIPFSMTFIDTPSTTSATTYYLYGRGPYKATSSGTIDMYVVGRATLQVALVKG